MSKKKLFLQTLFALVFNAIAGAVMFALLGLSPMVGAMCLNLVALVAGISPLRGVVRAGVMREIWTGEIIKALRQGTDGTWLKGIPDMSSIVDNDVIHLVDAGVDPDVIVNNKTYPIDVQTIADGDVAISLNKFQTKATPITDDEIYALSYDKMNRIVEAHKAAIETAKFKYAAHAIAPEENTDKTPVITTTGEYESGTKGRKRLTRNDIISLKKAFDKAGVPTDGRRLVLCPDHVNDLLLLDQKFVDQYYNYSSGKISRIYGFEVYEFSGNPLYTSAGVRKAVDSSAETGEYQASFAFYAPRTFVASGSTKMYYSEAVNSPEYQRNLINFRHYYIALPKKSDAMGAIVSGYTA